MFENTSTALVPPRQEQYFNNTRDEKKQRYLWGLSNNVYTGVRRSLKVLIKVAQMRIFVLFHHIYIIVCG